MTLKSPLVSALSTSLLLFAVTSEAQVVDASGCDQYLNGYTFANIDTSLSPSQRLPLLRDYLACVKSNGNATPVVNPSPPARVGAAPPAQSNPGTTVTAVQNATNKAASQSSFLGLNWGLGAGYAFGQGPRRVTASVVDNVVRVSSDVTNGPRVLLEAHYYPEKITWNTGDFGWGPFAAVETGSSGTSNSNGISGYGMGLIGGWKVGDNTKSSGFNIGVGYLWEGNVQTLGDGITANNPLPTGETQVRYKNQSVGAIIVFFSWTFGSSIPSSSASGN